MHTAFVQIRRWANKRYVMCVCVLVPCAYWCVFVCVSIYIMCMRDWWDENQYLFVKYEPVVCAQIAGPYTYRLPISQQFGVSRLLLALTFSAKHFIITVFFLLTVCRFNNTVRFVLNILFPENVLRKYKILAHRPKTGNICNCKNIIIKMYCIINIFFSHFLTNIIIICYRQLILSHYSQTIF